MTILEAIGRRDATALRELLADEVVFNSPVRSYRDRDQVVNLLVTVGELLGEVTVLRRVEAAGERITFVKVDELDGALDERLDDDGRISELTLLLRPLGELLRAAKAMGQLLAAQGSLPVQRSEPAAAASSSASPPTANA
jgi:hypothetical protein